MSPHLSFSLFSTPKYPKTFQPFVKIKTFQLIINKDNSTLLDMYLLGQLSRWLREKNVLKHHVQA